MDIKINSRDWRREAVGEAALPVEIRGGRQDSLAAAPLPCTGGWEEWRLTVMVKGCAYCSLRTKIEVKNDN
jgi:hypothetical protein